ncbi:MAG: damage-inducible protein CinA [Proteobacteria bacterium ST_bin12]|nr:MAG: damage-inducible protein CinA [Proteobacteria bacterium ST_bin12]
MDKIHPLAETLGAALKAHGYVLILAESCTGGMVAEAITSVAGSSAWFDRAYVTYSNQSKIDLLNVLSETLNNHGAVSEQTATEMALGCISKVCLNKTGVNDRKKLIAGSITGIAGPDGGTADKPVGTVCFAWASSDSPVETQTKVFSGNRQQIRQQATVFMLENLIQRLIYANT